MESEKRNPLLVEPLNDHGSIDFEVYLIAAVSSTFTSLPLKHSRLYSVANLSPWEVSAGTELMGESYRELFRDFLIEYNTGNRWWYVLDSDETDESALANLFDTTKEKLMELMVGAKIAKWHGSRREN